MSENDIAGKAIARGAASDIAIPFNENIPYDILRE